MCTYFVQANTEAPEDLFHVATLLHGDYAEVVLLVYPDQEGLLIVVPEGGKNSVPNQYFEGCPNISNHVSCMLYHYPLS